MSDVTISQLGVGTPTTGIIVPWSDGTTTYQAKLSSLLTATGSVGTGAMQLPIGNTAQRPAAPANGTMRFNTTNIGLEVYYNGGWFSIATFTPYRYWRYVVGTSTILHHPRSSKIIFSTGGEDTDIVVFTSDNCNDAGTIPVNGATYSYDFVTPVVIKTARIYSTFGGAERAANYSVQYSNNNSNWITFFSGSMYADRCGVINGTGGIVL